MRWLGWKPQQSENSDTVAPTTLMAPRTGLPWARLYSKTPLSVCKTKNLRFQLFLPNIRVPCRSVTIMTTTVTAPLVGGNITRLGEGAGESTTAGTSVRDTLHTDGHNVDQQLERLPAAAKRLTGLKLLTEP